MKHLFEVQEGTVFRKRHIGNRVPYVPFLHRLETTLRWHRDMGHTHSKNLARIMESVCYWPNMAKDIEEYLKSCEVCELHTSQAAPPKSVIPVASKEPFQQWALDFVGPMPYLKGTTPDKLYIVTGIDSFTR